MLYYVHQEERRRVYPAPLGSAVLLERRRVYPAPVVHTNYFAPRQLKILTSAEIGTRLEALARAVAPVLVAVYTAGFMLGQWLHATNDRMAAAYVRLLGLAPAPQPQPPAAKPQAPRTRPAIRAAVKAAVHKQPLTVEALVAAHTQRELMVMAGTKSKRSKKQLAERILSK